MAARATARRRAGGSGSWRAGLRAAGVHECHCTPAGGLPTSRRPWFLDPCRQADGEFLGRGPAARSGTAILGVSKHYAFQGWHARASWSDCWWDPWSPPCSCRSWWASSSAWRRSWPHWEMRRRRWPASESRWSRACSGSWRSLRRASAAARSRSPPWTANRAHGRPMNRLAEAGSHPCPSLFAAPAVGPGCTFPHAGEGRVSPARSARRGSWCLARSPPPPPPRATVDSADARWRRCSSPSAARSPRIPSSSPGRRQKTSPPTYERPHRLISSCPAGRSMLWA